MKYEILLLGKTKESFLGEGIREYSKRLQHYAPIHVKTLKIKKSEGSEEVIKRKEGEQLLAHLSPSTFTVALDSGGVQFSSTGLAKEIEGWEKRGVKHVTFLLGGPFGLAATVLQQADMQLSLSSMTFTHEMARLFLLEQLYRAYTIKNGEKYHK